MAKMQDLPLNPMKISGVCGRLLCCLGYECEQYREIKEKMPKEGTRVMTDAGPGVIVGHNALGEKAMVEYETGARLEVPLARLRVLETHQAKHAACSMHHGHARPQANPIPDTERAVTTEEVVPSEMEAMDLDVPDRAA